MNLIYKAQKNAAHPYVMILRETLYDKDLSLKAKGLLCFILSKPDDWHIYVRSLAAELKESKNTVAGIINELIEKRYCVRSVHVRDISGAFAGYDYLVFESMDQRNVWEDKHALSVI